MTRMSTSTRIEIVRPGDAADHEAIKALFVEYAESLGFSLAYQGFDTELAAFPGKYAPPTGALLLARADGVAAGTVALRQLAPEICEMKGSMCAPPIADCAREKAFPSAARWLLLSPPKPACWAIDVSDSTQSRAKWMPR
jgi:hypothetical protein